jgi:hypothetical protein
MSSTQCTATNCASPWIEENLLRFLNVIKEGVYGEVSQIISLTSYRVQDLYVLELGAEHFSCRSLHLNT